MAINRARPTSTADATSVATPSRAGGYGEAYTNAISNKELFAADEGSHYVAVNPTPGTGIIGHAAATTFDETKALLTLYNGNSSYVRVYLQSLLLDVTVVGVGHTRDQFTFTLDTGNLVSSGGTTLTQSNVNMDSSNTSGIVATFGAVVCSAATAARRLLGNYVVKGANIEVVWDQFEFICGAVGGSTTLATTPTTTAAHFSRHMPPIVIGPGQILKVHQWAASQSTGITFEPVINFIVR